MFNFQEEKFSTIQDELMPLINEHYLEVCDVKEFSLDVNLDFYSKIESTRFFKLYTVRVEEKLIGYSSFFISKSPHYNCFIANQDSIFISKKHRGFGSSFLKWCDNKLKEENVDLIYRSVKAQKNWSKILKNNDYVESEIVYTKRLI